MSSVLEVINHYRKSIEKSHDDEVRLLHCIGKLYKLPVTIHHLQETGIGKTVNFLRKFDGEVGVAAKALVTKWKAMVAAEESSSDSDKEEIPDVQSDDENSTDKEIEYNKNNESQLKSEKIVKDSREHKILSKHEKERQREKERHRDTSSSRNRDIKSNGEIKTKHIHNESHHISSHSHSNHHNHSSRNSDHKKETKNSSQKHSDTNLNSKSSNHSTKLISHNNNNHNNSTSNSIRKRRNSTSDNEDDKLIIDFEIKEEKLTDDETYINNSNIKLEDYETELKHNSKIIKSEKISGSSSSHRSHNNSKHKTNEERDEHHKRRESSSNHHNHHRSSSESKHREKIKIESEHNNEKKLQKSRSTGSSSSRKHNEISSSSSHRNHHKSSKTHSSSSSPPKKRKRVSDDEIENNLSEPNVKVDEGIDYTTGASFAEALGMMEKPKSVSKTSTKKKSNNIPSSSSSTSSIASGSRTSLVSPKRHLEKMDMPSTSSTPYLLAPTVKLKPLETELQLELPTITNNYKPMPLNPIIMDCVFSCNRPTKKNMTEDEALCDSISSRTTRTKIYSGMKTTGPLFVPSLLELCIRILQKNIDALEYTGGVPFDILRPVLERASAEQLFNFEDFNPYLIDETDVLWQSHCHRKFRIHKRREFETWREMFIRCLQEQEAKLMSLTENIKLAQVASVPVKQTKLAYVDSAAKPPRSVQRKQHQFGTDRKLIATPAARVASLSKLTSNIGQIGDTRLRVLGSARDNAQAQAPMIFKPKKAPLMAKTIQLMKGRYKR